MTEFVDILFRLDRLPAKITALVVVIVGTLMFAPDVWLSGLQLEAFREAYGLWFGIVFLVAAGLFTVQLLTYLVGWIQRRMRAAQLEVQTIEAVANLDPNECAVLREFTIQERNTVELLATDPAVMSLVRNGVILQIGSYGRASPVGPIFSYTISHIARPLLSESVLGFPPQATEAAVRQVHDMRPHFMERVLGRRTRTGRW